MAVFFLEYTPVVFTEADAVAAAEAVEAVRAQIPELGDKRWLSVPLINASGRVDDHGLPQLDAAGKPTPFLDRLPACRRAIEVIGQELGLTVHHARLLSMDPGGNFWPHEDAHQYVRFLCPLTASAPGHALYFADGNFYDSHPGEAWYLQPDQLHGAFNLTDQRRHVLCVDGVNSRKLLDRLVTTDRRAVPLAGPLAFSAPIAASMREVLRRVDPGAVEETCKLLTLLGLKATDVSVKQLYDVFRGVLVERGDCPDLQALFELHPYFPERD